MKFLKSIFLSVCAFLAVATTVTYTSCEKDSCDDLKCKNGGSCAEGFCRCKTGYEGAVCEYKIADRFIGSYAGYQLCRPNPSLVDTLDVYMKTEPNIVEFRRRAFGSPAYSGTATGYNIVVDDVPTSNGHVHVSTVITDAKEITIHTETYVNGNSNYTVCDFVGTRLLPK